MAVYYTTAALVRTELGYTVQQLSDSAAEKVIEDAEDTVDALLGGWIPDAATGRKILEGDVEPWQWAKLRKATTALAAKMVTDPDLTGGQQWKRVKGPDFEFEGPLTGRFPTRVVDLLTDSALRKLTGQAHTASQTFAADRDLMQWGYES